MKPIRKHRLKLSFDIVQSGLASYFSNGYFQVDAAVKSSDFPVNELLWDILLLTITTAC